MFGGDMTVYDLIRKLSSLRTKKGLSARALSHLIERDDAYIYKLENWQVNPSLATLNDIISACDASFEELFYFDDYENDREIIELLHACPQEKREIVLRFIRNVLKSD